MITRSLRLFVTGVAVLSLGLSFSVASSQAAVSPTADCTLLGGTKCQVTFTDTGSLYDWTVPSAATTIHVLITGGTGGSAGPDAASAGGITNQAVQIAFDASVVPGSHISVANGAGGKSSTSSSGAAGGQNPLGGYAGGTGAAQGSSGSSGGGGGGGAASLVTIGSSTYVAGGSGGAGGGSWNIAGSNGLAVPTSTTSGTSGGAGLLAATDGGGGGGGGGGLLGGQGGIAGCDHPPVATAIYCEAAGISAGGGNAGSSSTGAGIVTSAVSSTPGAGGYVVITYLLSPLPSAPVISSFTTGNAWVKLDIVRPGSVGTSPVISYQYSLGSNAWSNFSLASGDSSFTVTGLKNSTIYTISIRARNASGYGPASNSVVATPTNKVPSAPKLLPIVVGNQSLTVPFVDSTLSTSQSVTSHQYSINKGATWISIGSAASPILIDGLVNGVATYVQVRGVGSNGAGASSARVSAMPGTFARAPSISSIVPASGRLTVNFAPPSDTGGRKITNYQYSTNGGTTWVTQSPVKVKSPLLITDLPNGYAYDVTLRAVTALGSGASSTVVSQNLEFGTPVLNLSLSQVTNGPTSFIRFANLAGARPNLFSKISFAITPKTGSTTKAISASFSKNYLVNNGYFDATAGTIKLPIFGLYENYANTVEVKYFEGAVLAKSLSLEINTPAWVDPYGAAALYRNPEKVVARNKDVTLDFSYFMFKAGSTGSSPVVIDTDGEIRWVGIKNESTHSSIFLGNGMYVGSGSAITRTELDGRYGLLGDYSTSDKVTNIGHHNYDLGKDGILVEVDRTSEVEAAILEVNPVTGQVIRTFDLAAILENDMTAYGDNPAGFVRRNVDFFHNNSATYWAAQNTLVVSSRENFVIGIDYTTQRIKWILGDTTKLWYSYPSLRRYALTLTGNSVPPIGQHALSITADNHLMLFDNGKESLVQSPIGLSRFESVPRQYQIDLGAMTATETWKFAHNPVVYSPICSSIYQDGTSYLVNYASENLWVSSPLRVRMVGLDSNKNVGFEYLYPGNWETGWNASPLHLEGLTFN